MHVAWLDKAFEASADYRKALTYMYIYIKTRLFQEFWNQAQYLL